MYEAALFVRFTFGKIIRNYFKVEAEIISVFQVV